MDPVAEKYNATVVARLTEIGAAWTKLLAFTGRAVHRPICGPLGHQLVPRQFHLQLAT